MIQFIEHLTKDIDEIAGVQEVTNMTKEQQQSVHELKSISENLHKLSFELRKLIKHFKTSI